MVGWRKVFGGTRKTVDTCLIGTFGKRTKGELSAGRRPRRASRPFHPTQELVRWVFWKFEL
jgi:hypothetical protein